VVILRVPVLFGEAESVMESAVTSLWQKVQEATEESCPLDHCLQRFPTDTRDVATVCRKLAERARQDPSIRGIFHFSGKEQMTKYEMAVAIAQAFNLPSNHLIPLTEQPAGSAPRPINSQLNCSRLELLNLSVNPRAFSTAITECLWPFTADKRWRQTVFH
ncbi:Methionine adenosyltransferase 2 subunit beta, partial [Ataeniobius toweri]|nr:Methionine adenosyltransferase 2 subunit beta [Ataeniobius toweri]